MKRGLIVILVLVLFLSACEYSKEDFLNYENKILDDKRIVNVLPENVKACSDIDKDGYCSYDDCDDTNMKINPGMSEVCGDGIDNNCDSKDEDCVIAPNRGDDDWDGLLNFEETDAGTDPNKRDTDMDGLTDGQEVKVYFTNPLVADSDIDGYCDGGEVVSGTDPLDYDSRPLDEDRDGMDDKWEMLNFESLTYGANTDDDTARYEKAKTDGMINIQEYCFGLKGWSADSDVDGLIDGDEVKLYNTDPLKWDTDGDGFSDGSEVNEYRTSPLDQNDYAVFEMELNKHKTQFTRNKLEEGKHYAASYYRKGSLSYGQSISVNGDINA